MPALVPLRPGDGLGAGRALLSAWLRGSGPLPATADPLLLAARDVSPKVNAVGFDEPACLVAEPPRQLSLGGL
jgi:hypothetical protein